MIINWDEYFMGIAVLSSMRSKDPNTQVGACIVNSERVIVGTGYNGTPRGWDDKAFPWGRDGDPLEIKYPYVIHAELNAILNAGGNVKGATMYVTEFCCNECAKAIVQSGIKQIVYLSDKYSHTDAVKAAKRIFDKLGITYQKFNSDCSSISIKF